MNNQCSITEPATDIPGAGVWDDGEWISWDWVNSHITKAELRTRFPDVEPELVLLFQDLVEFAQHYKNTTNRYLPVFGELGELFAEIRFGIKRHKPRTQGSDGRLGNDFVEIKTITPEKRTGRVTVKRKGNFSKLVVVKISADFDFQARMIDRKVMAKGNGKRARVAWSAMKQSQQEQNHS